MRNDDKTFSAIVNQYSEQLYWHIRRLVVSHEDAEDILQETFIKAFRYLWTLRDEKALVPWLYKIATNEIKRHFGKLHETQELTEELVAKLEDGEYVDLTKTEGIQLQKALLGLSELQRTVFCLRYYDDMSYEDISYITGSSENTLKVSWHNAKKKVEQYLKDN